MESNEIQTPRCCIRCGDELPDGVRFCVACGTTNLDPDASRLAQAQCDIAGHERMRLSEKFSHWWRYWFGGIRR